MEQILLKPKDAAKTLAISERKLRHLKARGEIPCVEIGGNGGAPLCDGDIGSGQRGCQGRAGDCGNVTSICVSLRMCFKEYDSRPGAENNKVAVTGLPS